VVPERPELKKEQVATLIISHRVRLLDEENLWGGSKPIRDVLERRGWIYLDSPKWSLLSVQQYFCKKEDQRTEILHYIGEDNFPPDLFDRSGMA